MTIKAAKVAVSGVPYHIDKPYDYKIPSELEDKIAPGIRVVVPFSRSNRSSEGIVLSISEIESFDGLKSVISTLDDFPILTKEQISLALFMRDRFFCTVYDAFKAILPSGLWFDSTGKRKIKDKTIRVATLEIGCEEASLIAEQKRKSGSRQQANLLSELSCFGELPSTELLSFIGAGRSSLNKLVEEGLVSEYFREVFRRPVVMPEQLIDIPTLNSEQQHVYTELINKVKNYSYCVSLLQGITGSGKTSVYIKLIDQVLKDNKSVILLVPEIALTPQMIQTFSNYFGNDIAILHSSLSQSERYDEWKRIKSGCAHLVIGTRSAIFAPCANIGLIVIDEEQEDTYKSENSPRYNAEEIAKYISYKSECMLLLGSATPKISSRYFAETGKYMFLRLDKRYNDQQLPDVKIVDMKAELLSGSSGIISSYLKNEIQKNIDSGEQSILFLNRRGARKLVSCSNCGHIYKCPNCSVPLTYHSIGIKLMCHYCGYTKKVDRVCPDCGNDLSYQGVGTQLVEEEIKTLFPETEIIRIDTDVLSSSVTHQTVFDKFQSEKIPIMIGTQMVTKGLNFENVTLVGVLSADQSLYVNDYRAGERTFSLITQVVGRSGRGKKPGRAVIQTFTPNNEIILQASAQNYDEFYNSEIKVRKIQNSPPFCDYFSITVSGKNEKDVIYAANFVKREFIANTKCIENFDVLGPVPLNVVKVNNIFRYRINIKCFVDNEIRNLISNILISCNKDKKFKGISFWADINPND